MFETTKYKLRIEKMATWKNHKQHTLFYFAVIDLSKGAMYPLSWVCNLPNGFYALQNNKKFSKAFPNIDKPKFALKLLNDALCVPEYANDTEIKAEIEKRIKKLSPKLPFKVKCRKCGESFEAVRKTIHYCPSCKEAYKKFKGSTNG
jgi:hypothetical protein